MMTQATKSEENQLLETFQSTSCPRAFGKLYNLYYSSIFDYIHSIVKEAELSADLTQETFITAYNKLNLLRDNSMLRLWMFRVAKNKAMRHFREVTRKKKMESQVLYFLSNEQEIDSDSKEALYTKISSIISTFSHEEQNLIISKYFHQKCIKELEEETGLGSSAVKMKIHRLRLKMKDQIPISMLS